MQIVSGALLGEPPISEVNRVDKGTWFRGNKITLILINKKRRTRRQAESGLDEAKMLSGTALVQSTGSDAVREKRSESWGQAGAGGDGKQSRASANLLFLEVGASRSGGGGTPISTSTK